MTKTICDICGNEMPTQKSFTNFRDFNFCIASFGKIWDVCPECRESFNKWKNTRKLESEEKK